MGNVRISLPPVQETLAVRRRGLCHRVLRVVEARHSDGLAAHHGRDVLQHLRFGPGVHAVRSLPGDFRILDRPPLRELTTSAGRRSFRTGCRTAPWRCRRSHCTCSSQRRWCRRRPPGPRRCRRPGSNCPPSHGCRGPGCSSLPLPPVYSGGAGIVGGYAVHVLVEVSLHVTGIRVVKHAHGVHGHAAVLQLLRQVDRGGRHITVKVAAVVGLAVGKDHHDFFLPQSGRLANPGRFYSASTVHPEHPAQGLGRSPRWWRRQAPAR